MDAYVHRSSRNKPWRADRGALLRRMLAEGLEIVFSCVKAPWFDASEPTKPRN